MASHDSLTISGSAAATGLALALLLALPGCAIETGPPPESDPPLGPETARRAPPPQQPSDPQAWSRDLDLEEDPLVIDREVLERGLAAHTGEQVTYSGQPLTYRSAFNDQKPPSKAELARRRARERAAAAGLPAVAAAPVEDVSQEPLPPPGGEEIDAPQRRESFLPDPPEFPEELLTEAEASSPPAPAARPKAAGSGQSDEADPNARWADSRLPPPPTFPTTLKRQQAAAPAGLADEVWDAPAGTILVQVAAVQNELRAPEEWHRLQGRFPQVLQPLRLVVEEARLGERGVFYRVQGGAFRSREGAAAACDVLISQDQACLVVVR